MLGELAARLGAQPARPVLRVAVDGVDGAGKTTFADELAASLSSVGREVIRVSVDGFHQPRAVFHGWNAAEMVAETASLRCDRNAALFGLLLAFHRAGRAAEQGRPQRLAEAAAFARGCLNSLG